MPQDTPTKDISNSAQNVAQYAAQFNEQGWCKFNTDEHSWRWADVALEHAQIAMQDPSYAHWWRYQRTWFVGVNTLNNDAQGGLLATQGAGGVSDLAGLAIEFVRHGLNNDSDLDRGQISAILPGYPQPSPDESEAAFTYRKKRDAAHVDGLLKDGNERFAREYHAFIMAIALTDAGVSAAPLVVWSGSHRIMQQQLKDRLTAVDAPLLANTAIQQSYSRARQQVFNRCQRVPLPLAKGEVVVAHRHLLHGTAPWNSANNNPRILCFFRPQTLSARDWLELM